MDNRIDLATELFNSMVVMKNLKDHKIFLGQIIEQIDEITF